ncbi:Putative type II secretion system protein D [bacterium HR32]|nr:Putative type II secretion system protein D [bacterium HR32]
MNAGPNGRAYLKPGAVAVVLAVLVAALQLPVPQARAGLVTVTDVRVKEFPGKVQVGAVATGAFRYRLTEWSGKPKELVVVDLLGTQLGVPAGPLSYRDGTVRSVRVGQFNATTVRLVVELTREVSFTLSEVPGSYAVALTLLTGDAPGPNGSPRAADVRGVDQAGRRNLQAQRVAPAPRYTLVFRDAKVSDVMAALARLAGVNIVVSPEAGQKTVTLRLVNVTLDEALNFVTQPLELGWTRTGNNVLVMPRDKLPGEPLEIRYYRLQYASARDVAQQIGPLIFGQQLVVGAPTPAPAGQVPPGAPAAAAPQPVPAAAPTPAVVTLKSNVAVDERTNTLVVLASPSDHRRIEEFIRRVDAPPAVEVQRYALRYANPDDVAKQIQALGIKGEQIAVDKRTNSLLVVALRADQERAAQLIRQLDVPIPVANVSTKVYPLKWLNVDPGTAERPGTERDVGADIVALLKAHLAPSVPTITFDYRNNALVVTGTEGDHERVAALLAQIDTPVPQVIIEATVLDVNLDRFRDFGISWQWSPFGFQEEPTSPGQILFSPITRQPINFAAVIGALVSEGRARLLANPRVSTRDGQPAIIDVTDQVPFVAGVSPQGVPIIQFVSAGVTLNITPKINPDGMISTRILATVGAVRGAGQNVTVSQRRALTSLTVREGTPIVLAGLIRNEERTQTVKVPLLGDIPILGWLFRREERTRTSSEVVFVLTPRVLPRVSEQR